MPPLTFTVTKLLNPGKGYSCCFRNWRAKSHCNKAHGYDLMFECTLQCTEPNLTPEGWVIDFGAFAPIKQRIEETFDHKFLVADDDPELEHLIACHERGIIDMVRMPKIGMEHFALWYAVEVTQLLIDIDRIHEVTLLGTRVFENQASSGGFRP